VRVRQPRRSRSRADRALSREHATPALLVIHPVFERDRGFADSTLTPVQPSSRAGARRRARGGDLLAAYAPTRPMRCGAPISLVRPVASERARPRTGSEATSGRCAR
jgi:hypothetical protein